MYRHYLPRTAGSLSAGPTLISLAAPLRLGPSAQIFCSFPHSRSGSVPRIGSSARRRLPPRRRPATEGQSQARRRRRRLPPPSLASRLAPSPASSAHRPTTLRTHLPLPSRLFCSRGSPASCPGWPGLGSAGGCTLLQ